MVFFAGTMSLHDEFGNRVFSLLGTLLFLYGIFLHFCGEKIAQSLLKNDRYEENSIRIRPYFVLRCVLVVSVFGWVMVQAVLMHAMAQLIICILIFAGFAVIFICEPCITSVRYTSDHIIYQHWGKTYTIPMRDVTNMAWKRVSRSMDYSLVIDTCSGRRIELHSAYYVGLNKLRACYDAQKI